MLPFFFKGDPPSGAGFAVPIGGIIQWAVTALPSTDWLAVDGSTGYVKTDYQSFYDLWGPSGQGHLLNTGGTTFDMPDWRQHVLMMKAASGTGSGALGSKVGALQDTVSDHPSHLHGVGTIDMNNHTFGPRQFQAGGTDTTVTITHTGAGSSASAAAQAHDAIDIVQLSVVVNFIVRVR